MTDFNLRSLKDAFYDEDGLPYDYGCFHLYGFILSTTSTGLVNHFIHYDELNTLTSHHILIFQPYIYWGGTSIENQEAPNLELEREIGISEARDSIARELSHPNSFFRDRINEFVSTINKEVYELVDFCELKRTEIPCILIFSSLKNPQEFIKWDIKGLTALQIMDEFRRLMDKLDEKYRDFYFELREYKALIERIKEMNKKEPEEYTEKYEQWKDEIDDLQKEKEFYSKKIHNFREEDNVLKYISSHLKKRKVNHVLKKFGRFLKDKVKMPFFG